MAATKKQQTRMSNIEQGIPNDKVNPSCSCLWSSIFCGSLLNFCAACVEVTDWDSNAGLWLRPKSAWAQDGGCGLWRVRNRKWTHPANHPPAFEPSPKEGQVSSVQ